MYVRTSPEDNHYAHPLDFVPIVDLNTEKVRPSCGLPVMQKILEQIVEQQLLFLSLFCDFRLQAAADARR